MNLLLPDAIATYFAASVPVDGPRLGTCLVPDAVVHDDGQTHRGLADIVAWLRHNHERYQHQVQPLALTDQAAQCVVRTRVSGNFPGSPIELDHVFVCAEHRIQSLEIR